MNTDNNFHNPTIGSVEGVYVWQMPTYQDIRGRLFKAFTAENIELLPLPFITDEHFFTESRKNVFRGMHFQGYPHAVSKIISVVQGKAIDFLFDMRENSETFGNLQILDLDENNPSSIYIPTGVAHGYLALAEKTIISYRMDGPYCANCDSGFNGAIVSKHLPIMLLDSIRSDRDKELEHFQEYSYYTKCDT